MFQTIGAFASGVVVGWVARGVVGSERELLIKTLVLADAVKEQVMRFAAEQVEWWQDLITEARARVQEERQAASPDEETEPRVIRVA